MVLLTQDDEASLRKHPAGDRDSGKDTSCTSLRRMRKRGRRRVRRRRPNLLKLFSIDPDVPVEVLRSKKIPLESRCPEAKGKNYLVEDSWSPIQGAVSYNLFVMAARTANTSKLKIPGSSLETAVQDIFVPATRNSLAWESVGGRQPLGSAPNLKHHRSDVQARVTDALKMPSSPSSLCRGGLVEQT